MIVTVVGKRELDFKGSNGDQIKGTKLYVLYSSEDVLGQMADSVFVNEDVECKIDVVPGNDYNLVYQKVSLRGRERLVRIEEA